MSGFTILQKDYKYHYGFRLAIYPSFLQQRIINKNIDGARFYYNFLVAQGIKLREVGKEPNIYVKCIAERREQLLAQTYGQLKLSKRGDRLTRQGRLNYLKDTYPWMRDGELDSYMFVNVVNHYEAAWARCKTNGGGAPNFHKKRSDGAYQTNGRYKPKDKELGMGMFRGSVRFSEDRKKILLPKVGWVRCRYSKRIMERLTRCPHIKVGTVTVRRDAVGRYHVSLQLASRTPFVEPLEKVGEGSAVGIDLNVKNFLTDSNGVVVENPKHYRRMEARLNHAKRRLGKRRARAKKEKRPLRSAKNYQRQRVKVAKLEQRVANQRRNFLHTLAMAYVKNHDVVVAEELRSKNLLRNRRLAKSLQDVGHGMFLELLRQKAAMYGKVFVTVDPAYTTQTCHVCGHVMRGEAKLTLKIRRWTCPQCGVLHDRDHNAALNVLMKGRAKLDVA